MRSLLAFLALILAAPLAVASPQQALSSSSPVQTSPLQTPPTRAEAGGGFVHELLLRHDGRNAGDAFGMSAARAGDVDGDGVTDIVVGASLDDQVASAGGSVTVLSGADGSQVFRLLLGTPGDRFGFSVDGVGDVDQDGYADIVVGAPEADPRGFQSGIVYVISGRDASIRFRYEGDEAEQELGFAVAGIGDADGDGIGDFAIAGDESDSFPSDAHEGFARLYSGATGLLLREFLGHNVNSAFGEALAAAGDVDKDGHADWIVGAHGDGTAAPAAGSATVYSGFDGSVIHRVFGATQGDHFGASVSGAGDMNFDKHAEFMVGSLLDHAFRGSVRVFDGATASLLHEVVGETPDVFGRAWGLASAGDLDLDGRDDFLIGDVCDRVFLCGRAGQVRAYSGLDGALLGGLDGLLNDELGFALDSMGDLNGDGIPDILAGAFRDDHAGADAGAVFVYSGSPFNRRSPGPPARGR